MEHLTHSHNEPLAHEHRETQILVLHVFEIEICIEYARIMYLQMNDGGPVVSMHVEKSESTLCCSKAQCHHPLHCYFTVSGI